MPEEIINLLSDVRSFLQDKCEPPVYVSDRRLVKTVTLMQASWQSQRDPAFTLKLWLQAGYCAATTPG